LVQLSYAIGVAEPLSIFVETYGTSQYKSSQLVEIVRKNFDLRPGVLGIFPRQSHFLTLLSLVKELGLAKPIYLPTAAYGHFTNQSYPWEQPKQLILH
jgi:S-adenosylmethionine synthetase